ncbi:hypothetical protein ACW2QC_07470 [Virgibacillus sp. FSP13]
MADKTEKKQHKTSDIESKYSKDELVLNAKKAFGVAPEVVAGALFNFKQEKFTKKEVKDAIDKFLKRKV